MTARPLVLFDDLVARDWRPFTLTRPAGELLFGAMTLRARAERALGLECLGHRTTPALEPFDEPWARPVLDAAAVPRGSVLLTSRFVPEPAALPDRPALLVCGDTVVGLVAGDDAPDPAFFDSPDDAAPDLPHHELPGRVLDRVWELMTANPERLARDLEMDAPPSTELAGVHVIGDHPLSIGRGVTIDPGVVLDLREGSIRLEDGVSIRPFTHLAGPAWIGPGTTLLGGRLEAVSVGPVCKVRGEIEASVILGYSNKAHDGFLGHAYVGMWVNLGALTTNSDLKNNYGTVRVWTPAGEVDTGERKVGCLLGDHVKTAIGTMLNTGTVIEAGSNIFGGMPPAYVPPFSWGSPETGYDMERFLETAATVLGRREVELSGRQRELLRRAGLARET